MTYVLIVARDKSLLVKIGGLLSLVLDSILGSRLFGGDSDSDSSGEEVLGGRGVKKLTNLDILTE
jgi:hypothetical protein